MTAAAAAPGPAPPTPAERRGRLVLPLLVALALVKGLVWTLALPPWYGPDEPSHFVYTQMLAEAGRVPAFAPPRADGRDFVPEVSCSEYNLGWRINGPFWAEPIWRPDPQRCTPPAGRAARLPQVFSAATGGYSPLYYALGVPFYDLARDLPVEARLHAVRLVSVVLGVVATALVYLAGLAAFGGRRNLALAAATVFCLQPQISQQFAVVNNDALLYCAAALFFWRYFRALEAPLAARDGALLGLAAGLAYLGKPQGIFLALLLPYALWVQWKRFGLPLRRVAFAALGAGLLTLAIVGAGLGVSYLTQGAAFPQGAEHATQRFSAKGYYEMQVGTHFTRLYWLWITGFWGYFGWFSTALPLPVFYVIEVVEALAVVGVALGFLQRRFDRVVLGGAVVAVLATWLLTQSLEVYFFRRTGELILQGRSFLPLLPPLAIALTAGLVALVPRRAANHAAASLVAAALALNLGGLMVLLEGFFG